jgi:hypothetical protein
MRNLFFLRIFAVLGLSACATLPVPRPPIPSTIDTTKACPDWRWIAIKRQAEAACPKVAGWSVSPLFARKTLGQECSSKEAPGREVLRELNRFCVYEIADPKKSLRDLPFPPDVRPELVRFDRDCAALSPSGMNLEDITWKPLFDHFLAQVGHVTSLPGASTTPAVRLSFLDTEPDGTIVPADIKPRNSRHGYTLSHIARHLVCDEDHPAKCTARITTRLALPVFKFDPDTLAATVIDETNGGFLGRWTDLAGAIEREVDDWRDNPQQQRLVLNLSVAWDGNLFSGLNEEKVADMKAGTQAVYYALQYASGYGALVFAAAGNQNYGPQATAGPLLPAGWEAGAPGMKSCSQEPLVKPLVYAVGGVQSDGFPLANARRNGLPRRVAYADHVVAPTFDANRPTAIYTGSSVSTAVASAIAAVIWNTNPGLTAAQVMAILDQSGDVFDGSGDKPKLAADFWFDDPANPSGAPWVHRLSLCGAVQAAGLAKSPCAPWNPERPLLSSVLPPSPQRIEAQELHSVLPPCKAEKIYYVGNSAQLPLCPSDQYPGINSQPWLFPQPQDNPCPNCVTIPPPKVIASLEAGQALTEALYKSYRLVGVVASTWADCLVGATLDVDRPGKTPKRFSVSFPSQVCGGSEFDYVIDFPQACDTGTRAILSYVFLKNGQQYSVQSPVLLAR